MTKAKNGPDEKVFKSGGPVLVPIVLSGRYA